MLLGLSISIAYGLLHYGGVLMKSGDNGISVNDFDASWRDDGFTHFYWSGVLILNGLVGILRERKRAVSAVA